MALEPLADPISQLRYLPRSVNYATADEVLLNDPYYAVTHQYFKNDVCLSAVDDGAYVYLGGVSNQTATLGGADPSADPKWVSLAKAGANSSALATPVVAAGAGVNYAIAGGVLSDLPEDSTWLVTWHSTVTKATATLATDWVNWTLTGATSQSLTQLPVVDTAALSNSFSGTFYVVVGAPGTLTLTGATGPSALSSALAVTNTSLVAVRVGTL